MYFIRKLALISNGTQTLFADNLWPCLFFSLSLQRVFSVPVRGHRHCPFYFTKPSLLAYGISRLNQDVCGSQQNMMERRVLPILYIVISAAILSSILLITAIVVVNTHSNNTILVVNVVSRSSPFQLYVINESVLPLDRSFDLHHILHCNNANRTHSDVPCATAATPHSHITTMRLGEPIRKNTQ
jgi:hypothetical protein